MLALRIHGRSNQQVAYQMPAGKESLVRQNRVTTLLVTTSCSKVVNPRRDANTQYLKR